MAGEMKSSPRYDLTVVLSGPEPQVSLFEKQVCRQLKGINKSALIIRGMRSNPDITENFPYPGNSGGLLTLVSHLEINSFMQVLQQSGCVISRSGYSSVMDFMALGVAAMLVPSPGQSEQEYLGDWLSEKGWFTCVRQDELDLATIGETGALKSTLEKRPFPCEPDFQFIDDLYRKYYNNS
jgi:predicted glycosyltransferase